MDSHKGRLHQRGEDERHSSFGDVEIVVKEVRWLAIGGRCSGDMFHNRQMIVL
jgi:hypothetical protein